uniref:ATP-binding domain-containing protein n=1 Tax=Streptomyces polyasparticus TaxID=2767826 RepID=UPI003F6845F3
MSTESAAAEEPRADEEPRAGEELAPGASRGEESSETVESSDEEGADEGASEASGADETGASDVTEGAASAEATAEAAAEAGPSEAEAELAAQRELRERIEKRKAEKDGPIAAGGKLSGTAADLLAAVRAVESGEKPVTRTFAEPPAPRRPVAEQTGRAPAPAPAPAAAPVSAPSAAVAPAEAVAAVRAVLIQGGAPESLAERATLVLGESAEHQLREDPWQLLRVSGVRPDHADGFARALLGDACGPGDERRGRALTGWLLEQAAVAGHTALDADVLRSALSQRAVPDPDAAVEAAVSEGEVLVFQDALDEGVPEPRQAAGGTGEDDEEAEPEERPVRVLFGLEQYALAEESLADGLARLVNALGKEEGSDLAGWENAASAVRGSAAELIRAAAANGLTLHTGGTAARAEAATLLKAARELGLRVCGATHTVDGRRQLAEVLDSSGGEGSGTSAADAVTVAQLLSGAAGPGRDAEGALAVDLLVVLDAPQLDVETAAMLVESLPDGARLVLSGDPAVLWSAGAGRVFADLLAARVCPQITSRTPDPGPIGELTSGITIGELNQIEAPGKEVVIVPVRDPGEAVHRTVQLVADSVPRAFSIPAEATQVVTVAHGGPAGTRALNTALKERLNPGPGRFGGFDPGDRIAYAPVPGRTVTGLVVGAEAAGLRLECEGVQFTVAKDKVGEHVRHAWALTAHQAVGHRWPAVVAVLPGDAAASLTRPWVYTAFSRAARHLSVVHGVDQALPRAVAEIPAKPRTTRLERLVRGLVPAQG